MSVTTLVDLFRTLEKRRGEFLVYDDGYRVRRHSYADVTRAARGFAARLIAHGVLKGDKVLLWGENRPEWIACYWGIQLAGAIAVPIDYRSSQEFAERIRRIVDAKVILAGDDTEGAGAEHQGHRRHRSSDQHLADGRPRLVGGWADPDRSRSIATTSRRSSSRPAPRQIPRAWSSAIATSSRTWCRSRRRSTSTRSTRGRSRRSAS